MNATTSALTPVVDAISVILFEGNVVPHEWYAAIKTPSGKTDLPTIIILSEIIYWYRPIREIDPGDGRPMPLRKKFADDMFQASASYFEAKFGLTKEQARGALRRLEDAGLIRRDYRDIVRNGQAPRYNVPFIEPIPERIFAISHPEPGVTTGPTTPVTHLTPTTCKGGLSQDKGGLSQNKGGLSQDKVTKTSTETSTETTTTTSAGSGSSNSRSCCRNITSKSEPGHSRPTTFAIPEGLTPSEAAIARKRVEAFPNIAQDLLDELAGQMQAKRVAGRTINPIPYLDGLIRSAQSGTFQFSRGLAVREAVLRRRQIDAVQQHNEVLARSTLGVGLTPKLPKKPGSPPESGGRFQAQRKALRAALTRPTSVFSTPAESRRQGDCSA